MADLTFEQTYDENQASVVHKVRPKYSWLNFDSNVNLGRKSDASGYGDLIAVMKDDVKFRSTLSITDSLSLPLFPVDLTFYGNRISVEDGSYLEAHIWGEVDTSDVAYFAVHELTDPSVLPLLRRTGIPIRKYRVVDKAGRKHFRPGAEIYVGNPIKQTALENKRRRSLARKIEPHATLSKVRCKQLSKKLLLPLVGQE